MGLVHASTGAQAVEGSTVLLVESPAKAKKLQHFLGPEYKVRETSTQTGRPEMVQSPACCALA